MKCVKQQHHSTQWINCLIHINSLTQGIPLTKLILHVMGLLMRTKHDMIASYSKLNKVSEEALLQTPLLKKSNAFITGSYKKV